MHKAQSSFAVTFSPYPSPPSVASSDNSYQLADSEDFCNNNHNMGANSNVNINGVGILNYQRAIDLARNSEGELDPTVSAYLEGALADIWSQIRLQPDTYVMSRDQFAVFNFYRLRFDGNQVAEQAVARYWLNTRDAPGSES